MDQADIDRASKKDTESDGKLLKTHLKHFFFGKKGEGKGEVNNIS